MITDVTEWGDLATIASEMHDWDALDPYFEDENLDAITDELLSESRARVKSRPQLVEA